MLNYQTLKSNDLFSRARLLLLFVVLATAQLTLSGARTSQIALDGVQLSPAASRATPDLPVVQQDSHATTYQIGSEQFQTHIAVDQTAWQDVRGQWQPYDLQFRNAGDQYVVSGNRVRSRANLTRAAVAVSGGSAVLNWQAQQFGVSGSDGFQMLATALESGNQALVSDDGRRLDYYAGWSDATLHEALISDRDLIEHILIVDAPPTGVDTADHVDMLATLTVLPGSTLWADGVEQQDAFSTAGSLELRDALGRIQLVLQPVVAFEQSNAERRVAGDYVVTRDGDIWQVTVRTPADWWAEPTRRYPVVLDPTITVLQPYGHGVGTAFIGVDPETAPDGEWHYGGVNLGTWVFYDGGAPGADKAYPGWNSDAEGYFQFNVMPALLTNAPVAVSQATLDLTPVLSGMPGYAYDPGEWGTHWKNANIQKNIAVYYIGSCPESDAPGDSCSQNDFDLLNGGLSYSWNGRPQGTLIGKQPVTGKFGESAANKTPLSYDVTTLIQDWFDEFDDPQFPRPAFRVVLETDCTMPGPYNQDYTNPHVGDCLVWHIAPESINLRIDYEALTLTPSPLINDTSGNKLNDPGIPTYEKADNIDILADTSHEYKLAPTNERVWRAVAARSDHFLLEDVPDGKISLSVYTPFIGDTDLRLVHNETGSGDRSTVAAFINDHYQTSSGDTNDLDMRAQVQAHSQNDWRSDPQRNYRVHYREADAITVTPAQLVVRNVTMRSDQLLQLLDFELTEEDTFGLWINAPTAIEPRFLRPTDEAALPGSEAMPFTTWPAHTEHTFNGTIARSGHYAIAFINHERPEPNPERPEFPIAYSIKVTLIRCPKGTVPAPKFKDVNGDVCQPLILPTDAPPMKTVNGLNIYNRTAFNELGNGEWCTQNEVNGTPIIGPAVDDRYIYVAQGTVCYKDGQISFSADSGIGITRFDFANVTFDFGKHIGFVFGDTMTWLPDGIYAADDPDGEAIVNGSNQIVPADEYTLRPLPFYQNWQDQYTDDGDVNIDLATMKASENGTLAIEMVATIGDATFPRSYDIGWQLYPKPHGASVAQGDPLYFFDTTATLDAPYPTVIDFASLELRALDGTATTSTGIIDELNSMRFLGMKPQAFMLRNENGRITQPDTMGGASQDVQLLIQPPGTSYKPSGSATVCLGGDGVTLASCLDLRMPSASWSDLQGEVGVSEWKLPDIHIEGEAGSMRVDSSGQMTFYSNDHPNARSELSQSFSYDTFGATVSVAYEECFEGDGFETTVIKGTAGMTMPNVNDDGGGPGVEIAFKVCETALAQVYFKVDFSPTGIVVGSTGVSLQFISADILIAPTHVTITFELAFQSVDGTFMQQMVGAITIDTRGMFELNVTGKFFSGVINVEQLLFRVAWVPFDMLLQGEVGCCSGSGLIEAGFKFHMWVGQGWQNKYHWLPNNDELHFTGMLYAQLNIDAGMVVDEFPFVLPPFSFSIRLDISFGEFCVNSSCTQYEWGMAGVLSIAGYGVGLYIGESGIDLILGSNDHILIDEFGGSRALTAFGETFNARAAGPNYPVVTPGQQWSAGPYAKANSSFDASWLASWGSACVALSSSHHVCDFSVSAGSGRAFFAASWQNGTLIVELERPDSALITAANADSFGAVYSATQTANFAQTSYAVEAPANGSIQSGTWKLHLKNVGAGLTPPAINNYSLLFVTDPPPPAVSWNTPATQVTPDSSGDVQLDWQVTRDGAPVAPGLDVELFYILLADKPVTPTEVAGAIISRQVDAADGGYTLNLPEFGMASGEYAVGMRIDDKDNANGSVVSWAPGSILFNDTTPPPIPKPLGQTWIEDGLLLSWECLNDTVDLAGYFIEYSYPDWNGDSLQLTRRLTAGCDTIKIGNTPVFFWESILLGGLKSGYVTEICVRSYDQSGNISGCDSFGFEIPTEVQQPLPAPDPVLAERDGSGVVNVYWDYEDPERIDGYLVNYYPLGCRVPWYENSGDPQPVIQIADPFTFQQTIDRLSEGQRFRFDVYAYIEQGQISPYGTTSLVYLDPADLNSDGLPDKVADLYGLEGPGSNDTDLDGISDAAEIYNGTNPLHADSDGDGYYDSEEADWGTDPCNSHDKPPYHAGPKLKPAGGLNVTARLTADHVTFSKRLTLLNGGGGDLTPQAISEARWLFAEIVEDENGLLQVLVRINEGIGWETGKYSTTVKISNLGGRSDGVVETLEMPVEIEIIPEQAAPAIPTAVTVAGVEVEKPTAVAALVAVLAALAWTSLCLYTRRSR